MSPDMRAILYTLLGIAAILILCFVTSPAFSQGMLPFEERDCGTIGNVLAVAGAARDKGMKEQEFKDQAAEALKGCREANGLDGCSVRNEQQQKFVDDAFDFLWSHPKTDGSDFATEFYHECKKQMGKGI